MREAVEGMTASVCCACRVCRRLLASYPLSATSRLGAERAARRLGAAEMSALFPGVSRSATARPHRSVSAWIFVVGPPRERPMA